MLPVSTGHDSTPGKRKDYHTNMKSPTTSKATKTKPSNDQAAAPSSTAPAANDSMLLKFFCGELKDIYWAEKHLLKTLPKMAKAATSAELKQAFLDHKVQTETQVARLEQAFEILGKKAQAKKCDAMDGITQEGEGIIEETEAGTATRDVGLVLAGQKAEHYEIATYGGLVQLARTLGQNEVAELLETTLQEEKDADQLLSQIAERNINYQAAAESSAE